MEGVWPQPALNLRARIEQLVASHTLHNTTYGKRLRAAAATLNTSPSPDAKARFCGKNWWQKVDRADAELGKFAGRVQAAHDALEDEWKAASAAFDRAKTSARNAARTADQVSASNAKSNPARTAEQISASNEARTAEQISASNAKTNPARPNAADLTPEKRARKQKSNAAAYEKQKKSEKEQAAARRKSKHEAYHTRVRDVLQANKAAQPLGDVDAATGACTCPKHIFCAKCPAEKYAQAKRTVEATELLFHDATNVGCGMELADADGLGVWISDRPTHR